MKTLKPAREYETNYNELLKVITGARPDTLLSIMRFAKKQQGVKK
jgi:hypothetical protein